MTFMDRVEMVPFSGCWYWAGATNGRYGKLKLAGRLEYAHRVSYQTHYGPVPEGLMVLHRCDEPLCVNPDHLFLGTQTENMRDCIAKGRFSPPPVGLRGKAGPR